MKADDGYLSRNISFIIGYTLFLFAYLAMLAGSFWMAVQEQQEINRID